MRIIKSVICVILSFLVADCAIAHPHPTKHIVPTTMSLRDAVYLALRYNPNVHNAHIKRILDKFNLRIAEFEFEWQYSLDGSADHTRVTSNGTRTVNNNYALTPKATIKSGFGTSLSASMSNPLDSTGYRPQFDVSITQPLIKGFGYDVVETTLHNAYDDEYLNKLTLRDAIITEVTNVINAYWSFVQAKVSLRTQQNALRSAQQLVSENNAMIRAGRMAPNENITAKAGVASQRLAVTQARYQIESARQTLLKTIGFIDPQKKIDVLSSPNLGRLKIPSFKDSMRIALRSNSTYQQLIYTVRKDRRAYTVARDNARVKLDANLSTTFGPGVGLAGTHNGQNKTVKAGLTLSVPIKDLNSQQAVLSAKITLDQDLVRLREGKRNLEITLRQALNDLRSQRQQIFDARSSVQLATDSLHLEQKKLKFGLSTSINVTSERNKLTSAEISLINAKIAYLKALAGFHQTLGTTLREWGIQVTY